MKQCITGRLFLIPVPLVPGGAAGLPAEVKETASGLRHFFVENVRTARRFLKEMDRSIVIDELSFSEMNQHTPPDRSRLEAWLLAGVDVGVMSEAGCPGVADPGSVLVAWAHSLNATVVPLLGPNSMLLALMASGLNGQQFRFSGYLPVKEPARSRTIRELETTSRQRNETQIFMETPYRNNQLLAEVLSHCQSSTRLCIASNITAPDQFIQTKPVAEWKKDRPDLHKKPAVFLLLAG